MKKKWGFFFPSFIRSNMEFNHFIVNSLVFWFEVFRSKKDE